MRFSPNEMEFGVLDDFEKSHKVDVKSKSNVIWGIGCKMKFNNSIRISPSSKKVKGLIRNKNHQKLVILGLLGI